MWVSKRESQWSERAIARTTPVLLGLFSLVTLVAHEHYCHQTTNLASIQLAAWYTKTTPTFSDAASAGSPPSVDPVNFSPITRKF
jgi:hypothetical protein